MLVDRLCPCGSAQSGGQAYDACCGPLVRGEHQAPTPERLMRSRYTAHAVGDAAYLWRTWHPRTRPAEPVALDPAVSWTGLQVLAAGDDHVHFRAAYDDRGAPGVLEEDSAFERRAGRWFYVGPVGP